MKTIQVQALTAENFARYGEFQNLLDDASLASKSVFPYGFFADVVKLDLGGGNLPTVSVCQVKKTGEKHYCFPGSPQGDL